MWQFCWSAILAGLRSHSIRAILILGVLLVGIAYLASSFSPRQPRTVTLDVGFSGLRFSLLLFALFWVQELVARELERRSVLFALTYPISRSAYLLGRYLGILILLALGAALVGMMLWVVLFAVSQGYEQGFSVKLGFPFWATVAGLWLDSAVVAAFAVWIAVVSTTPMMPLGIGAAFAIAGKSLGGVVEYLISGADGDVKFVGQFHPVIQAIRWVIPDLSRLDWRAWPMYGMELDGAVIMYALLMAIGYIVLMLSAGLLAFSRREFD